MTDRELINILKTYKQLTPEIATIIAERMEQLIALAENGQSAMDTNKRLSKTLVMAIEDIKTALHKEDTCELCVHYIECKGKECEKYFEFNEAIDEKGNVIPWKGDCLELNWGDCPMQDDKPCKECFHMDKFIWRGETK